MPTKVFDEALRLLLEKDMRAFTELFAADCVLEFPFAEAGSPTRLDSREALWEYLHDYPDRMDIREFPAVEVHRTLDPDTIIAEFTAHGRTVSTGGEYEMRYIAVITVRDGLITRYRDYWSPVMAARAAGELPALVSALREEPSCAS
ncbi:nuclear transport factor 2 family protein [Saccharopolyspora erythraea]|uniref:nuclear transport factor 2 family protein n=1 Tax=Saccharopolyspora erythraea TaxID=1836 RepID=UPI001BA852F9|nr:nuclear transport factor 2 family protein [Saccharopolyspora erythraea]QUH05370.1 nuclear transport factor 2 family protein [Saccharopolyspora erythraea]